MTPLDKFPFRPIYHILIDSRTGTLVPEASRALAENQVRYIGTNYDYTSDVQPSNPQVFLVKSLDDALTAKQELELLHDVRRAILSKFDGPNASRSDFTLAEAEKAGEYGYNLESPNEI